MEINKSIRVLRQKGAVVKTLPAVTQNVTADLSVGDTVIPVVDASQFTVGYDVMIGDPGSVLSYPNTIGEITAVNTSNNTITISAYKSEGMQTAYATGTAVASQTFATFYTNRTLTPSVEISPEFWGLTFDGNPQPNEPAAYPMAPIFIGSDHTKDPIIMFNEVLASASDGISDQSDGGGYIQGNTVRNCTIHGIHLGFTNGTDMVIGNRAYNCGTSEFFWCFGVTEAFAAFNYAKTAPTVSMGSMLQSETTTLCPIPARAVPLTTRSAGCRAAT